MTRLFLTSVAELDRQTILSSDAGCQCPRERFIEIKKASRGFEYQQKRYSPLELSRVVILCAQHDLPNVPPNVDVIQLESLCSVMAH